MTHQRLARDLDPPDMDNPGGPPLAHEVLLTLQIGPFQPETPCVTMGKSRIAKHMYVVRFEMTRMLRYVRTQVTSPDQRCNHVNQVTSNGSQEKAPPMLMIPTGETTGRLVDLPNGPQLLAASLWEGSLSPHTIKQRVLAWMKAVVQPVRDVTAAMEAIAWGQGLPFLEKILDAEDWLALGKLLSSLPAEVDPQTLKEQPLLHQLVAGELAWTLAGRMTAAPLTGRLKKSGRSAISLGLGQTLDRQGMPSAEHFRCLRSLLACWTRCRALAGGLSAGGWGPRSEQRYQRLVRNALRCNRPDGRPLLTEDEMNSRKGAAWGRDLFEAVLKSGVDEIDRRLAAIALPNLSPGVVAKPPRKAAGLPPPSIYFEDGAVAVLRRNWNRDDERIAVLFAKQACEIELISSARVVMSGAWQFEITQQGRQLEPVSNWESSCWHSDEDVDYLELEIELTGGVKLQRQFALAREDRFLFLADVLMSPQRGNLEYRSLLPLAAKIEFRGAAESREGFLLPVPAAVRLPGNSFKQPAVPKILYYGAARRLPGRWPRSCPWRCRNGVRSKPKAN